VLVGAGLGLVLLTLLRLFERYLPGGGANDKKTD
jgi:hypothetical protein